MKLKNVFHLNEIGLRPKNDDHIFPKPGAATVADRLFIVCDGVGGYFGGDLASRMVCDGIADRLNIVDRLEVITEEHVTEAIRHAQLSLHKYSKEHPKSSLMSSTLTLAYFNRNSVVVAWCGDSKIYQIRNGLVIWKSKDHSLIQQLIDSGTITEEEASDHREKNVLLRCLSASEQLDNFEIQTLMDARPEDYILLCTDGILENIDEYVLKEILENDQIEGNKQKLFLDYCREWTMDNYSMYLVKVG